MIEYELEVKLLIGEYRWKMRGVPWGVRQHVRGMHNLCCTSVSCLFALSAELDSGRMNSAERVKQLFQL
jgi:hypothetical protein